MSKPTALHNIYRRHTKNMSLTQLTDLEAAITCIMADVEKFKSWLSALDKIEAKKHQEYIEWWTATLPKKFINPTISKIRVNSIQTIKDVYENISKMIWNNKSTIQTKLIQYNNLNKLVGEIVEWGW